MARSNLAGCLASLSALPSAAVSMCRRHRVPAALAQLLLLPPGIPCTVSGPVQHSALHCLHALASRGASAEPRDAVKAALEAQEGAALELVAVLNTLGSLAACSQAAYLLWLLAAGWCSLCLPLRVHGALMCIQRKHCTSGLAPTCMHRCGRLRSWAVAPTRP